MDFKYPYTDYHELNLDWFLSEFKNLVETWARTQQDWISMQEYIRDYFDNLNVQTEIDNKINAMILDGTFSTIVEPFVTAALPAMVAGQLPDVVAAQLGAVVAAQINAVVAAQLPAVAAAAAAEEVGDWLAAHIDPDTGYVIDDTLTVSQAAADAKVTGDLVRKKIDKNVIKTYYGTLTEGHWRQSNGNEYERANGYYSTVNVIPGTVMYANGTSVNGSFPLLIFLDVSDNILDTYYTVDTYNAVSGYEFTVPDNCVKIYVNGITFGATGAMYPCLYTLTSGNITGDSIIAGLEAKATKINTYQAITPGVYETEKFAVVQNAKVTISNLAGYSYLRLIYDPDKKYAFTGVSAGSVVMGICTDSNNNVLATFGVTNGTYIRQAFSIPDQTYYIYVNGRYAAVDITNAKAEYVIERNITSLRSGKKGLFLGDSITQGANVFQFGYAKPYEDYPSIACDLLGAVCYNGGLGGSAYSQGRTIDFENVVECLVSGDCSTILQGIDDYFINQSAKTQWNIIKDLDISTLDFVCISYGTNDYTFGKTIADITTAMLTGISELITEYPNLQVYILTPINRFNIAGSGQDADDYVNALGIKLPDVCSAIIDTAKTLHVPCKNMYHDCNINTYNKNTYMGDNTHPNKAGYNLMGEIVAGFINAN